MGDDFGLFGPGSVTWKVHREPIITLGGLRSLYLQALLPRAVAGVMQNSSFKQDPWGRLDRTARYVTTVVFGTIAQAEKAGRRVRAVHARLHANDPRTGEVFRLDEPELLRWVHITEVESFLDSAVRSGLRLTPAETDTYFLEQRRSAALVGLEPDTVPGSAAEVEAFYREMRPKLAMTVEAADSAVFLTVPPLPYGLGLTPLRGIVLASTLQAVAMLPSWARRLYGLPGLSATTRLASLNARAVGTAMRALPHVLFEDPMQRAALRRVALTEA
jgi:uncharacterized protein (DUF2236 family)